MTKASLEKAFGYQGDPMSLPVTNLVGALPFYVGVLGFHVRFESNAPQKSAILARDQIQIGLTENGGDPTQDGCAFHVRDLDALLAEFNANGLGKTPADVSIEHRKGEAWKVFYVVAPDGLCYWFGEQQPG